MSSPTPDHTNHPPPPPPSSSQTDSPSVYLSTRDNAVPLVQQHVDESKVDALIPFLIEVQPDSNSSLDPQLVPQNPFPLSEAPTSPYLTLSPMSIPSYIIMRRSSSAWTSRSRFPDSLPAFSAEALSRAVQTPLNLLRSLVPSDLPESPAEQIPPTDTVQLPAASVGEVIEACKALESIAQQSAVLADATADSHSDRFPSRRSSSIPHSSDFDDIDFTKLDLYEIIQKVVNLVGRFAAPKGVDIVLDLEPKLEAGYTGLNYSKLIECQIWADPLAIKFLLTCCLTKLVHSSVPHSTLEISSRLQIRNEPISKPGTTRPIKLIEFTLELNLIPPASAQIVPDQRDALHDSFTSSLLNAFGVRLQGGESPSHKPNSWYQEISIPFGYTPPIDSLNSASANDLAVDPTASQVPIVIKSPKDSKTTPDPASITSPSLQPLPPSSTTDAPLKNAVNEASSFSPTPISSSVPAGHPGLLSPSSVAPSSRNSPLLTQSNQGSSSSLSIPQVKSGTPNSPLPADALEYFSETAAKMGGSAASGMVIQSPDGRPAGIFFQPKPNSSVTSMSTSASGSYRKDSNVTSPIAKDDSSTPQFSVARMTDDESGSEIRRESLFGSAGSAPASQGNIIFGTSEEMTSSVLRPKSLGRVGSSYNDGFQPPSLSRYPSGSIFTPQVGIQSVLNSIQPPLSSATSIQPNTSTPIWEPHPSQSVEKSQGSSNKTNVPAPAASSSKDNTEKLGQTGSDSSTSPPQTSSASAPISTSTSPPATTAATKTTKATSTMAEAEATSTETTRTPKTVSPLARKAKATRTPTRQRSASSQSSNGSAPVKRPPQTPVASKTSSANPQGAVSSSVRKSAPSSPVISGPIGSSGKLAARQSFAMAPSPSDSKRPSAQPQSGFMIGMGFAPSARKGTGPKKVRVRETVLPPIKVLIVEDNPINQRILSTFMARKKIKFDVANNGREAVEKWQTGGFHLILMDLQLPVMDGIEATKEIRKLERQANIGIIPSTPPPSNPYMENHDGTLNGGEAAQANESLAAKKVILAPNPPPPPPSPFRAQVIIVALTASVSSSDRVEALAAGCNDFLNKPVSHHWLNQKILEWGSMMYLMYSGLSEEHIVQSQREAASIKAQVHIGFGYGPSEKAKALASNLHMGSAMNKKIKAAAAAAVAAAAASGAGSSNDSPITSTTKTRKVTKKPSILVAKSSQVHVTNSVSARPPATSTTTNTTTPEPEPVTVIPSQPDSSSSSSLPTQDENKKVNSLSSDSKDVISIPT